MTRYPVIGELTPPPGLMDLQRQLGLGHNVFDEYDTPTMQGLARVDGRHLELLVIAAKVRGRGDGGRFLAACMAAYDVVSVYEVDNPVLRDMLARRGFVASVRYAPGDGIANRMQWKREG